MPHLGALSAHDEEGSATALMRAWMGSGALGCFFAQAFAADPSVATLPHGRVACVAITADLGPRVARIVGASINAALRLDSSLLAVFPRLRSTEDVARLIGCFNGQRDWKITTSPPTTKDLRVRMQWYSGSSRWTTAMGLGPLGSMPPTRRSPYFALALWPGGLSNPFHKAGQSPKRRVVSLADMKHELTKPKHKKYWDDSEENSRAILIHHGEDAEKLRRVSFVLDQSFRALLA